MASLTAPPAARISMPVSRSASTHCHQATEPTSLISRTTPQPAFVAGCSPQPMPRPQVPFVSAFPPQPLSQTVVQGQVVTFSVGVVGAGPLTDQWHFNGGDLAGATNASLSLSNVTTNQAGRYLANISNALGSTNSDPAVLWVVPAP